MRKTFPLMLVTALAAGAAAGTLSVPAAAQDAPAAAPEKVQVRVSAKKGDKLLYLRTQNQGNSMMGMESGSSSVSEETWTCASVADDGSTTWDVATGKISGKSNNPATGEIDFDTTKKGSGDEDPSLAALTAFAGSTLQLTLGSRGQISKVGGTEKIVEAVSEKMPGQEEQVAQALSPEAVAALLGMAVPVLPEGGAVPGQAWSGTTSLPLGPGQTFDLKLTNVVSKATDAEVEVTTKPVFDFKEFLYAMAEKQTAAAGMEMTDEIKQQIDAQMKQMTIDVGGEGTARFSRKDGLLIDSALKLVIKIAMSEETGGMTIEQSVSSGLKRVDAFAKPAAEPAKAETTAPAAPAPAAPAPAAPAPATPAEPEKK